MINSFLIKIMLFGVMIISISYLVYRYYDQDNRQVMVIYPDLLPTKIKPQDSGGILLPNSNNIIYENLRQKKVNRNVVLQPEPEKPLNITQHKVACNIDEVDSIDNILSNIIKIDKTTSQEANKLKENENTIILPETIKSSTEDQIATASLGESITQTTSQNQIGLNIVKLTETHRKIDEIALNNQKPGGYQIQLASVKSESEANHEGERLKKKYTKILNDKIIKIKKVKSGNGNYFYLLLMGNYDNISQAKAVCKKLATYQQNCIITK